MSLYKITFCEVLAVLIAQALAQAAIDPNTNSIGMKMIPVPAGSFIMGSTTMDDNWNERPAHQVTISHGFLMSETEVTLAQFQQFLPDFEGTPGCGHYVAGVSWTDATGFCDWLSRKEDKPYRLPTEAEWEYACRAGTVTPFSSGDQPPAPETANAWGLKNMHTGVRDILGSDGHDYLAGNAGDDTLEGGAGNDIYDLRTASGAGTDTIVEAIGAGIDTVLVDFHVDLANYANIENINMQGSANINGVGSAADNIISGNSGNNVLAGLGGKDHLSGNNGSDTLDGGDEYDLLQGGDGDDNLMGGTGHDTLWGDGPTSEGGYGDDTLAGGDGNDKLYGGVGNDSLKGDAGNDLLDGGAGDDTYFVDQFDTVKEAANAGFDTTVIGSRPYMAPEQILGKSRLASDVWALGVILYALATECLPSFDENEKQLMDMILEVEPERPSQLEPDLPEDLERIILWCLEKDLAKRYPDAMALHVHLTGVFPGFGSGGVLPPYADDLNAPR